MTVIVFGLWYSIICLILYFNHKEPILSPLLNIEFSKYYPYEVIYCIPMGFLFWITFIVFIQILARYFGEKGSFEETLYVLGMELYVPVYIMAFVDLLLATHILPESLF